MTDRYKRAVNESDDDDGDYADKVRKGNVNNK